MLTKWSKIVSKRIAHVALSVTAFSFISLALAGDAKAQVTNDLLMNTYPSTDFTGTPITTGPVTTIDQTNLNPGGRGDFFSVRVQGYVFADTTGTYTFETYSDDGVRLFIDGTTVINNYGRHAPTINTGTIDLVAGTWYPILLEHYEWGGGQRLRLRWSTPTSGSRSFPPAAALSQTLPVSSEGPPLNTQDDRVAYIITEEAARSLRSDIETNQRANQNARARHAAAMRCRAQREESGATIDEDCQDSVVSRGTSPLQFNGALTGTDTATKLAGDFYGESSDHNGTRHLYFGDFEISRFEGGDVSAVLSARYARERMSGDRLLGYFLGLSLAQSNIKDVVDGNRTGYGVSAGVYVVDQLSENLTWDGFLSVGAGRNNLDVTDGSDDITGDYNTTSALMGVAISGAKEFEQFELRPELNFSVGYTDIGDVAVSGGSSAIVDAGGLTLGRISLEPDFVFDLATGRSRFDTKELWVTPSLTCEYQDTTYTAENCGGGLAVEWTASRDDGLLDVSFRASREVLGGGARDSIGFQLESAF